MTEITIPLELAKRIAANYLTNSEEYQQLVKFLPEEKLETGRWIKDDKFPKWMKFFVDETMTYGFSTKGVWVGKKPINDLADANNRYATEEEIRSALIAEAERRAYRKGNYKCLYDPEKTAKKEGGSFGCDVDLCILWHHYDQGESSLIFKDGVWAEKIATPEIPESLQTAINELGKEEILKLLKQ